MWARGRGHDVSDRLTKGSGSQDRTGELYCSRAASLVEGLTGPCSISTLCNQNLCPRSWFYWAVFSEEANSIIVFVHGDLAGEVSHSGPLSLAGAVGDRYSAGKVGSARHSSESAFVCLCIVSRRDGSHISIYNFSACEREIS